MMFYFKRIIFRLHLSFQGLVMGFISSHPFEKGLCECVCVCVFAFKYRYILIYLIDTYIHILKIHIYI